MVTLLQRRPPFLKGLGVLRLNLERLLRTAPTRCSKVSLLTRPRAPLMMAALRLVSINHAGLPALRFRYQLTNGILRRHFRRRTVWSACWFSRRRSGTGPAGPLGA